jgi:uncharacterized protein
MKQLLLIAAVAYCLALLAGAIWQRSLLYLPSRGNLQTTLDQWVVDGRVVGFCKEAPHPQQVWLMLHGNAGQASLRAYALPSLPENSSLYVLEYPGYGSRDGSPSQQTINRAARDALEALQKQHGDVAVLGESLGSGPASYLAGIPKPPVRIALITPYDTLANAAAEHFPWLPVRLLLRDNWDNVEALRRYRGSIDIYVATNDEVIPPQRGKHLAAQIPTARLHEIPGGHNDWSAGSKVRLSR